MNISKYIFLSFWSFLASQYACNKTQEPHKTEEGLVTALQFATIDKVPFEEKMRGVFIEPVIHFKFSQPLMESSINQSILITDAGNKAIDFTALLLNHDSTLVIHTKPLQYLSSYNISLSKNLKNKSGGYLKSEVTKTFSTSIDSSRKFPKITDAALLTKVQRQTFTYFWDFAHPISGLARERNTSGNLVTIGGSGFGVMSILVGISRNFVTRSEGRKRLETMVGFLKDKAQNFHGAFPHWMDGSSGKTIPFSEKDNGADLVETSFLIQGLIAAREYFSGNTKDETNLRNSINIICDRVEWNWFTRGENVLYWHWSPEYEWSMNLKIQGWNECLITYVLAASSKNHSVLPTVYEKGWTKNGAFQNGNKFYNYTLPLGENLGGPLFFEHYSFLGINPSTLKDKFADYSVQTKNHTLINYSYCVDNPKRFYGYSDSVWGLTASDIYNGYTASSPTNDRGFIAPTAALSSFPYTPDKSMAALHFYYYVLGDKLFKDFGFVDAFSLHELWFSDACLAIDQGPIIVMLENYRTGLLWELFMKAPEVKTGLEKLGFRYAHR